MSLPSCLAADREDPGGAPRSARWKRHVHPRGYLEDLGECFGTEQHHRGHHQPACRQTGKTKKGPSANTVRNHLKEGLLSRKDLQTLEAELNELLVAHIPSRIVGYRHRIVIDLVLLPYYGEPAKDLNEIRRSAAKRGTTRFHCYATAYVIKPNKRVTLALTYVQKDDSLLDVLKRLLARLETLNVGIRRLYLDRGFYAVEIIRFLKTQSFPPAWRQTGLSCQLRSEGNG